jgi:hypothetical protein
LTVANNAPTGTTVGVLTVTDASGSVIPSNFMLTRGAAGYFAISNNNLITEWTRSIASGYFSIRVRAIGINNLFTCSARFTVTVGAAKSTAPIPTGIAFIPAEATVPDNATAGTTVAATSVSMSDGSAFSGTLSAGPADTVAISGNTQLVLARDLDPADDGSKQWMGGATQNGMTVSSPIQVQVAPSRRPRPKGITFTPTAASLPDNAGGGSTVAAVTIAMSDGSSFSGSLVASPAGTVKMSGSKLVLARGLTSADDGSHQWGVAATENKVTISGGIAVRVIPASSPPPPTPTPTQVTFTPTVASLPDNAAAGTTVAAITLAIPDGSPFSGSFAASPAGTVTVPGGRLVLARALTPADDGSHQWTVSATQNGVTVSGAIQVQVTAAGPPPAPPPPPSDQLSADDGSAVLTSDDGSSFLMVS